jgi:hypothetical protein
MGRTFDNPNPTASSTRSDTVSARERGEPTDDSKKIIEAEVLPHEPLHEPEIRLPEDSVVPPSDAKRVVWAPQAVPPEDAAAYTATTPPYTPPAPGPVTFKELQTVLKQTDSNFVFPVGMPESGKTVALYAMLRYLLTANSPGRLFPFESPWKAVDRTGEMLNEVASMFRDGKMPKETAVMDPAQIHLTKQANYEFAPHTKKFPSLRMTIVDFGGEKYADFLRTEQFPPGIDVFFKVGGLSLTFLLMTSPDYAAKDDHLFSLFLGHIAKLDPAFRKARAAVVLTKWDTYGGRGTADDFVEQWMPMTYAATRNPSNALMCFTVGSVGKDTDGTEWIREFNPAPAAALFRWFYQSITHVNLDAKPWWQRFLKAI